MTKKKWLFRYVLIVLILSFWVFSGIDIESPNFLGFAVVYFVILFFTILFTIPILIAILLGIKHNKQSKGFDDYSKEVPFFRDIIDKYSISAIAADYDLSLDVKKQVVLNLMYLNSKNKISIKNGYIEVIDTNTDDLDVVSAYILCNIKDGYVKLSGDDVFNYQNVYSRIKNESLKSELVSLADLSSVKTKTFDARFWIIEILLVILSMFVFSYIEILNTMHLSGFFVIFIVLLIFVLIISPLWFPIVYGLVSVFYFGSRTLSDATYIFTRTSNGKQIMTKLYGLDNFLKEFSTLHDKKAEEIKLWDEYLIYSVLFGINKQIFDEYKKLIK